MPGSSSADATKKERRRIMFRFAHNNINVLDLKRSLSFYEEALGLKEVRRMDGGDFTIVYLGGLQRRQHPSHGTRLRTAYGGIGTF